MFFSIGVCTSVGSALNMPKVIKSVPTSESSSKLAFKGVHNQQNENRLTCIYFNARSLVNKFSDLELCICVDKPDIIGVTETWLNANISDNEFNFDDYSFFRRDRTNTVKKRGGG